jgi:prepilin-type N-terminal cleavage/methylation domain-containing protein
MTRPHRPNGFSLIELVVALAIIGVVTTIGSTMLIKLSDLGRQTEIGTRLDAAARNALGTMRADFGSVVPSGLTGMPVRGETSSFQDMQQFWAATIQDDALVLPVQQARSGGPAVTAAVRYAVDRQTGALVRTTGALHENAPAGNPMTVAEGVLHFSVEFQDGPAWVRGWDRPGMPGAVRVTLSLMDPARPYEQITRKAVFPIHVD